MPRKRPKKSTNIDFSVCCPVSNNTPVPKHLLQIRADETEIKRRVNCFIERKREEIDINNVQDFIGRSQEIVMDEEDTCARVRSTAYRVKGSNSHLRGEWYCDFSSCCIYFIFFSHSASGQK